MGRLPLNFWALRKGPPFHGSRSSSEIETQNGSCQMGGREVTGRYKLLLSARKNEWSRSYRVTKQHPSLPWNFMTHGFLDPFAFPDLCLCSFLFRGDFIVQVLGGEQLLEKYR